MPRPHTTSTRVAHLRSNLEGLAGEEETRAAEAVSLLFLSSFSSPNARVPSHRTRTATTRNYRSTHSTTQLTTTVLKISKSLSTNHRQQQRASRRQVKRLARPVFVDSRRVRRPRPAIGSKAGAELPLHRCRSTSRLAARQRTPNPRLPAPTANCLPSTGRPTQRHSPFWSFLSSPPARAHTNTRTHVRRTTLKDGLRAPPLRQARTGQPAPPPAATLLLRRKRDVVVALAFFAAAAGLHDPRWRRRRSEPTAQRDRLPLLQHELPRRRGRRPDLRSRTGGAIQTPRA